MLTAFGRKGTFIPHFVPFAHLMTLSAIRLYKSETVCESCMYTLHSQRVKNSNKFVSPLNCQDFFYIHVSTTQTFKRVFRFNPPTILQRRKQSRGHTRTQQPGRSVVYMSIAFGSFRKTFSWLALCNWLVLEDASPLRFGGPNDQRCTTKRRFKQGKAFVVQI